MNPAVDNRVVLRRIAVKVEKAALGMGRLPYDNAGMLMHRTDAQREQFVTYLLKRYGEVVSVAILNRQANAN